MNTLHAHLDTTKYCDFKHLVISIDGKSLDQTLAFAARDEFLLGLVCALDGCFSDENDSITAWSRIYPEPGRSCIAPLLICPDDLDFDCTVVVALVENTNSLIKWLKLGIDRSANRPTNNINSKEIAWFSGIGPFEFTDSDYKAFLDACRQLKTNWWSDSA